MTKPNSTLIVVVMDRSGSMAAVRNATISGFNEFIKNQKMQPGEAQVLYCQFDHEYEVVYPYINILAMPELNEETYVPRGTTALLDAIGRTILSVGSNLASRPENERPSNVMFVIQTDGAENASTEFKRDGIVKMIETQTNTWKWNFMFLGASLESIQEAQRLGVSQGQTLYYSHDHIGTQSAFASASGMTTTLRSTGQTREFTEEERSAAVSSSDWQSPTP